jgi:hypothetical protein
MWSPLSKEDGTGNDAVTESLMLSSANAYTFSGGELITAFNNNPNLLNLRNDYSIWGERTGASGAAIPVHMRYAIDKKPISYRQITVDDEDAKSIIQTYNLKYGTTLSGRTKEEAINYTTQKINNEDKIVDWREVIYQMALDYYKYNILDDFEIRLIEANPQYYTG